MKHLSLFLAFLFVAALGAAGCGIRAAARTRPLAPAQRVVVDVSVFYDELAPYGRWFTLEGYGWVWTPYGVSAGWRPYTYTIREDLCSFVSNGRLRYGHCGNDYLRRRFERRKDD